MKKLAVLATIIALSNTNSAPKVRPSDNITFNGITTNNMNQSLHISSVSASANETEISVKFNLYVNSLHTTVARGSVNGVATSKRYENKDANTAFQTLEIKVPNVSSNLTTTFNISLESKLETISAYGEFNFDNNTTDIINIIKPGQYSYEIINEISFDNNLNRFNYQRDIFNFAVLPPKMVLDPESTKLVTASDGITISNKVNNGSKIFSDVERLSGELLQPGIYDLESTVTYTKGAIKKDVIINYTYQISGTAKCLEQYYCLKNGGDIIGTFIQDKTVSIAL